MLPSSRRQHRASSRTGPLEAQGRVECISSALVLGAQALNRSLSISTLGLGGVVGAADVGQLVADEVGDDVGVQGVALAAVGNEGRVGREEGALGRLAVELGAAQLEVHCRRAVAEVCAPRAGCGVGSPGHAD